MAKDLTKSHRRMLQRVSTQLQLRHTMAYTQIILSEDNQKRMDEAKELVDAAIAKLKEIR